MRTVQLLLLTFAAGLLGRPVCAQPTKAADPGPAISRILRDHHVPGAAVALVAKDSVIWLGTLGLADAQRQIPVTANTLFGIGSISKTVLATATMIAQEQGLVNIQAPVEQLAPSLRLPNPWQATDPVRLVHLLEHTAGVDEAHLNLFAQDTAATPLSEVLRLSAQALIPRWKPGHYYAYSTLGAVAAAHVLAEAVAQPFEHFVSQRLLLPLGMRRATYHPTPALEKYLAKGYAGPKLTEEPFSNIPQWPAGSLLASPTDMASFVRLFLNRGAFENKVLLTPASIARMETPETSLRAAQGIRYGYGKGLRGRLENGYLFYGHDGSYGGFLAEFGYSPDLEVGYVILLNNRDGKKALQAIKQELFRLVLPAAAPPAPPVFAGNPARLRSLAGCYQPITTEIQITQFALRLIDLQIMVEEEGQLYQRSVVGGKLPLLQVGPTQFRRTNEPMATSAFVRSANGQWQWLDETTTYQQVPLWWGYAQFFAAVGYLLMVLLAFVTLVLWVPVRLLRKQRKQIGLLVLPLLAVGAFAGMGIALTTAYSPFELYSAGAVLFMACGWLFLLFSLVSLCLVVRAMYRKQPLSPWVKYHALLTSLACCAVAGYLLYWRIIGLTLWDY